MSSEAPDESPVARVVEALGIARNAKIGALAGVVLATLGAVLVETSPYRSGFRPQDLVLLFVVLVSTTLLVTVALTVRAVVRLTISPPKWIRRSGTLAAVGGSVCLGAGLMAPVIGAGGSPDAAGLTGIYGTALPAALLVTLAGVWGVHASHRHDYGYHGLAGALLAGLGLVGLAAVVTAEPAAFLGRPIEAGRDRTAVLAAVGLALGSTTLLGTAVTRVRRLPATVALGSVLALPVGLLVLAVATALRVPHLVATAVFAPLGTAWILAGYALRAGRGIPPAETFGNDVVADTAGPPDEAATDPEPDADGD